MKTKNINILLITLCLALTFTSFSAEAGGARDQSDQLTAQINVTRDALSQVLTKMRNAPNAQTKLGSNPDFVAKANEFNKKVEVAMAKFEDRLQNTILSKAAVYIQHLNAIQNSNAYTASQKDALLADQVKNVRTVFEGLSKQYQDAILDLYDLDLPVFSLKLYENTITHCEGRNASKTMRAQIISSDQAINGMITNMELYGANEYGNGCHSYTPYDSDLQKIADTLSNNRYYYKVPKLREYIFGKKVREGCFSATCLVFSSSHRIDYLNLISADIDKAIDFRIGDYLVGLTPLDLKGRLLNGPDRLDDRKRYLKIESGDTKGMPFEISDREYQEILEKQKRSKKLDELKSMLLNPPGGLFSSYECPAAKLAKVKEELCQSELRCISETEMGDIIQIIKDADVYSKSARIECLQRN